MSDRKKPAAVSAEAHNDALKKWAPWAAVITILVLGGFAYRRLTVEWLAPSLSRPVKLPVPLKEIPLELDDGWVGEDHKLSRAVERIAGNDDYVFRLYRNYLTGESAYLYVAYSGRPRFMVGHRPDICYPSAGWSFDGVGAAEIKRPDGATLLVNVHRFHKGTANGLDMVVLNYYVLNGKPTKDAGSFSGVSWRLPNISGNPAYYVAQVQISSRAESSARKLAGVSANHILRLLPDESSTIRAAKNKGRGDVQAR